MDEQAVRTVSACGTCGAESERWVVQLIRANRLRWEADYSCARCGTIACDGDWGPAPADVRAALVAEHGEVVLLFRNDARNSGRVLKAFRDALGLTLAEAKSAAEAVRGQGFRSTRVEGELVRRLLGPAVIRRAA
ncbi:hypothetical protein EAO77_19305 [Streptomyces sp. t39]|nr:hypothetical protein EAO77_19305 [Streptomyces sp. t39]